MTAIQTVGIYLTEGERRLLISLENDLEIREQSTLRASESPEATQEALVFAATRHALSKLMNLPAEKALDAGRSRAVVREAIAGRGSKQFEGVFIAHRDIDAIADRVASELGSTGLSSEDREALAILRDDLRFTTPTHAAAVRPILDRLLGATP